MTTHQDTSTERDMLIDAARQALGFLRRQEVSFGDMVAGQYADKLSDAVQAALASRDEAAVPLLARHIDEWHEDDGPVMWWAWNGHGWAGEPAWVGTPNDPDWPGYHTHWTAHPQQPHAAQQPQGQQCRSDGRCQYAIDHGAEGLGACPPGKCVQPQGQAVSDEAVWQLAVDACAAACCEQVKDHPSIDTLTLVKYSPAEARAAGEIGMAGQCYAAILALRDKPEQRVPLSGWQPIETAPKDGTEILLLFSKSEYIVGKPHGRVRAACWSGSGSSADWSIPYFKVNAPTHWQPLPPPPNGITAKEQGNGN